MVSPFFVRARSLLKNTFLNKSYIAESYLTKAVMENSETYLHGICLDVGCGTKPYYNALVKQGVVKHYYGLEYPGAENWDGHSISNVEVFGDGQSLPLKSDTVDSLMSIAVIGFFPEPFAFLSEAWRVLKPGGVLFFTAPSTFLLLKGGHYFRFTKSGLEYLLKKRGFNIVKIENHCNTIATIGQLLSSYIAEALIIDPTTKRARPLRATLFLPFCGLVQIMSLLMGSFTKSESLTVAYTVVARK